MLKVPHLPPFQAGRNKREIWEELGQTHRLLWHESIIVYKRTDKTLTFYSGLTCTFFEAVSAVVEAGVWGRAFKFSDSLIPTLILGNLNVATPNLALRNVKVPTLLLQFKVTTLILTEGNFKVATTISTPQNVKVPTRFWLKGVLRLLI